MTRRGLFLMLILGSLMLGSCVQYRGGQPNNDSGDGAASSQLKSVPEGLYYKILTNYGLGLTIDESDEYLATIVHVEPLSPAGKSGIAIGSSIVSVDGRQFANLAKLNEYTLSKDSLEFEILHEDMKSVHRIKKASFEYKAWFRKESR